jgi:ectoine hydroxylase-related dioxygenase (phytanoyl-CoA dioxygenase family)
MRVLTSEQMDGYEELGFVHSVPILTPEEVRCYRGHVEKTWAALGGGVTRADGLHLFFSWAWDLVTHPRLLDCLEDLIGPVIILRHTRIFYKYAQSAARVNWHQDGCTENISDARVPAIWLGLTDATVENGCLQVVPRSHRLGMQSHWSRQAHSGLASSAMSDREPGSAGGDEHDLSGKTAKLPEGVDAPFDVVMKAGEMSFHHPVAFHGSNPNTSVEPRIGLSATYSPPGLQSNGTALALVRGSVNPQPAFPLTSKPVDLPLEEAVAAYRASGRQILYAPS